MANNKENETQRPENRKNPTSYDRRRFLNQALAASAGIAMSGLLPHLKAAPLAPAAPPAGCIPSNLLAPNELLNPGEITSVGTTLKSVLVVHDEKRTVPGIPGKSFELRAYAGYSGTKIDPAKLVTKTGVYYPGPTFRAKVGDTIQIALLNHINPLVFPESPNGECTIVDSSTPSASGTKQQIYPSPSPPAAGTDKTPDCFRGSNTTNLHFHGTHVSPNAFSDNVLIEIAPDLKSTPAQCERLFPTVACKDYPEPHAWQHQDAATTKALKELFAENQKCLRELAPEKYDPDLRKREAKQNDMLIEYGEFPQYWCGCFPYCIRPPKFAPPLEMGQSPGTHWYHAHKHGSTSIQIFNGMAGALILEDDSPGGYDQKLKESMPGVEQKILVLQEFAEQPNMERVGAPEIAGPTGYGGLRATPVLLVNGQALPTITMQTNEVQWWRIIDATVHRGKGAYICNFTPVGNQGANIAFRQIAQDGVQFHWDNYQSQIAAPVTQLVLGPANRVDILVKAPSTPGTATFTGTGDNILNVNVVAGSGCNTKWPNTEAEFPKQPDFLKDITAVSEHRILKYQMAARGGVPMINDKTFKEGRVDESMLLGTRQEWTIYNYSVSCPANTACNPNSGNPLHPFHIHVNPFQILEVSDPAGSLSSVLSPASAAFGDWSKVKFGPNRLFILPAPWVWWDTFPLPLAKSADPTNPNSPVTPGYIKFRTWFADFAGKFVDHCHILAHEDRGMMQLIEVVSNKTPYQHH